MSETENQIETAMRAHVDAVQAWHKAIAGTTAARKALHAATVEQQRAEHAAKLARDRVESMLQK